MQKREQGKPGGGSSLCVGKVLYCRRCGRPSVAPWPVIASPQFLRWSVGDQNNKRLVFALQSGMKSELNWALNTLTLLSFNEKEDLRKDATPLAKIPCLLDALLQVGENIGSAAPVTGLGNEYDMLVSNGPVSNVGQNTSPSLSEAQKNGTKSGASLWWLEEDGLFNLDDEGRAEKQIHKRLVDLISIPAYDAQAAAIGALDNLAELNVDCRLKLTHERWAIDRLLNVIKTPHPVPEICRKAAIILKASSQNHRTGLYCYHMKTHSRRSSSQMPSSLIHL
ncbi:hypothetical protein MLD38_016945 [Melastoma candidum]|uniref:Uncharacterized protein n=1 Tax=Melastoma candidum TaxID=119954 RepID=A0ACB9QNY1_9MYRT|nr:hypothetical protein MLD38_016945 [Melastoma candidum]